MDQTYYRCRNSTYVLPLWETIELWRLGRFRGNNYRELLLWLRNRRISRWHWNNYIVELDKSSLWLGTYCYIINMNILRQTITGKVALLYILLALHQNYVCCLILGWSRGNNGSTWCRDTPREICVQIQPTLNPVACKCFLVLILMLHTVLFFFIA